MCNSRGLYTRLSFDSILAQIFLPIYAGNVDDDIDHVAAEFVALHVDGRRVGGDVDLGEDVEEEGLFGVRVGDEDVEKVLERRQLRNQLLHDLGEAFEDGVVVDGGLK